MNDEQLSGDHRYFAVHCNNSTWGLIENDVRSDSETEDMIHRAHASCWHWSQAGEPVNLVRAHYLVAKAYFAAGRVEEATYWASRCWDGTEKLELQAWDLAFGLELKARVHASRGETELAGGVVAQIQELLPTLEEGDREICEAELQRAPWFGVL